MRHHHSVPEQHFGVSFSIKQCQNFNIDPIDTLEWLIKQAGFRRFRLMSYWNEHQKTPGNYDFTELDQQISAIEKAGGSISLCLGARQPRWPENHWPDWTWQLTATERSKALMTYLEVVVKRYRVSNSLVSWQLENEALLTNFGERPEVDRQRLKQEFDLVKKHDPSRPVIMTTSTSWGIPLRRPIPDIVGFSYYHTVYNKGAYRQSTISPLVHRLRKTLIKLLHDKPVFVHELQMEPWGPAAIWEMDLAEQSESMSPLQIHKNVKLARSIKAGPIDLWGGEWWYWRLHKHHDPSIWQAVAEAIGRS